MSPQPAREINAADAVGPDLLLCKQLSRRRPLRPRFRVRVVAAASSVFARAEEPFVECRVARRLGSGTLTRDVGAGCS
jgi:hypothetical protein